MRRRCTTTQPMSQFLCEKNYIARQIWLLRNPCARLRFAGCWMSPGLAISCQRWSRRWPPGLAMCGILSTKAAVNSAKWCFAPQISVSWRGPPPPFPDWLQPPGGGSRSGSRAPTPTGIRPGMLHLDHHCRCRRCHCYRIALLSYKSHHCRYFTADNWLPA